MRGWLSRYITEAKILHPLRQSGPELVHDDAVPSRNRMYCTVVTRVSPRYGIQLVLAIKYLRQQERSFLYIIRLVAEYRVPTET